MQKKRRDRLLVNKGERERHTLLNETDANGETDRQTEGERGEESMTDKREKV